MSWPARYEGKCAECGEAVEVGQQIEYADPPSAGWRRVQHVTCPESVEPAARPTCPRCFMEIALSGECGC